MLKAYKGYSAKVSIDEDLNVLHGEILGTSDVVTFQGSSIGELTKAFHDSVDDYLAFCEERGKEPERPFSGRFVLRLPPELHREVAIAAQLANVSMNEWIVTTLTDALAGKSAWRGMPRVCEFAASGEHIVDYTIEGISAAADEARFFGGYLGGLAKRRSQVLGWRRIARWIGEGIGSRLLREGEPPLAETEELRKRR